ncbi:uncharacterized protein Nmag_0772 [Natrialba magadii ATCC 43099]|uniref:Uncharacterized protein n=1 Tax=Natrialba magadii (strain ATCC 43099 / DSM 3394 / CCM 3739 / CIP 104546 / IAM 13178 / JCM 8861 / NBRC 102185 / NCIMB 2190 / MS3) TaxID=547559 RepID=D3SZZ9_NATMM|nr:uncharacterized protein Nmag_0772 [Natrialba magadii ATCC 43099]ELY26082.1 hypothetical protein C500_16377 [Natrialba magadii ATCC 43099]
MYDPESGPRTWPNAVEEPIRDISVSMDWSDGNARRESEYNDGTSERHSVSQTSVGHHVAAVQNRHRGILTLEPSRLIGGFALRILNRYSTADRTYRLRDRYVPPPEDHGAKPATNEDDTTDHQSDRELAAVSLLPDDPPEPFGLNTDGDPPSWIETSTADQYSSPARRETQRRARNSTFGEVRAHLTPMAPEAESAIQETDTNRDHQVIEEQSPTRNNRIPRPVSETSFGGGTATDRDYRSQSVIPRRGLRRCISVRRRGTMNFYDNPYDTVEQNESQAFDRARGRKTVLTFVRQYEWTSTANEPTATTADERSGTVAVETGISGAPELRHRQRTPSRTPVATDDVPTPTTHVDQRSSRERARTTTDDDPSSIATKQGVHGGRTRRSARPIGSAAPTGRAAGDDIRRLRSNWTTTQHRSQRSKASESVSTIVRSGDSQSPATETMGPSNDALSRQGDPSDHRLLGDWSRSQNVGQIDDGANESTVLERQRSTVRKQRTVRTVTAARTDRRRPTDWRPRAARRTVPAVAELTADERRAAGRQDSQRDSQRDGQRDSQRDSQRDGMSVLTTASRSRDVGYRSESQTGATSDGTRSYGDSDGSSSDSGGSDSPVRSTTAVIPRQPSPHVPGTSVGREGVEAADRVTAADSVSPVTAQSTPAKSVRKRPRSRVNRQFPTARAGSDTHSGSDPHWTETETGAASSSPGRASIDPRETAPTGDDASVVRAESSSTPIPTDPTPRTAIGSQLVHRPARIQPTEGSEHGRQKPFAAWKPARPNEVHAGSPANESSGVHRYRAVSNRNTAGGDTATEETRNAATALNLARREIGGDVDRDSMRKSVDRSASFESTTVPPSHPTLEYRGSDSKRSSRRAAFRTTTPENTRPETTGPTSRIGAILTEIGRDVSRSPSVSRLDSQSPVEIKPTETATNASNGRPTDRTAKSQQLVSAASVDRPGDHGTVRGQSNHRSQQSVSLSATTARSSPNGSVTDPTSTNLHVDTTPVSQATSTAFITERFDASSRLSIGSTPRNASDRIASIGSYTVATDVRITSTSPVPTPSRAVPSSSAATARGTESRAKVTFAGTGTPAKDDSPLEPTGRLPSPTNQDTGRTTAEQGQIANDATRSFGTTVSATESETGGLGSVATSERSVPTLDNSARQTQPERQERASSPMTSTPSNRTEPRPSSSRLSLGTSSSVSGSEARSSVSETAATEDTAGIGRSPDRASIRSSGAGSPSVTRTATVPSTVGSGIRILRTQSTDRDVLGGSSTGGTDRRPSSDESFLVPRVSSVASEQSPSNSQLQHQDYHQNYQQQSSFERTAIDTGFESIPKNDETATAPRVADSSPSLTAPRRVQTTGGERVAKPAEINSGDNINKYKSSQLESSIDESMVGTVSSHTDRPALVYRAQQPIDTTGGEQQSRRGGGGEAASAHVDAPLTGERKQKNALRSQSGPRSGDSAAATRSRPNGKRADQRVQNRRTANSQRPDTSEQSRRGRRHDPVTNRSAIEGNSSPESGRPFPHEDRRSEGIDQTGGPPPAMSSARPVDDSRDRHRSHIDQAHGAPAHHSTDDHRAQLRRTKSSVQLPGESLRYEADVDRVVERLHRKLERRKRIERERRGQQ